MSFRNFIIHIFVISVVLLPSVQYEIIWEIGRRK